MKPIIRVENLGKHYRLGIQRASYATLRDSLSQVALAPFRRQKEQAAAETLWALRDISFTVQPGEVVGIVGRNGAGKSTLLKILSRITEPAQGKIDLYGRVGSLLEVGTGFHPELTGRENIYLNGAILGMKRTEIAQRFEEIVEFAEIARFIDTPVKHYSSGMYMRLAFSIAAHLDPEILIIDEVLAVGDVEFQNKCLGKMQELAGQQGRTVLFVSHNLAAVRSLCSRAFVLRQGQLAFDGATNEAIEFYMGNLQPCAKASFAPQKDRPSITGIEVMEDSLERGDLVINLQFESPFPLNPPIPGIVISSMSGVPLFGSNTRFHQQNFARQSMERGTARIIANALPLAPGSYKLSVWLGDWQTDYDQKKDVISFDLRKKEESVVRPRSEDIGHLDWPVLWEVEPSQYTRGTL